MLISKNHQKKLTEIVNDPAFQKPIANLFKDYSRPGVIILVTKIKPKYHETKL